MIQAISSRFSVSSEDNKHEKAKRVEHVGNEAESTSASLPVGPDQSMSTGGLQSNMPENLRELSTQDFADIEKKLVRKIDFRILPVVIIMYILNYLDRNNIAAARVTGKIGLQEDLGLSSTQYNTCVSILFVGYILMQVPSNLFLNKIGKPALYLPAVMVLWGVISTCTAASHSFGSLVVIRFLLGFVEAAYFPGCIFFLSSWYTRKELALRNAILMGGLLIAGAFSGLIAAGISYGLDGARGIVAWRWLFIIEGCATIFVALCAFFILPDFPRTTTWLSPIEKSLGAYRLERDIGEDDWTSSDQQSFFHGCKLALQDGKMYLLMIVSSGIVSSSSFGNFFPTVVGTLGYGNITTLLLTAPPYILAILAAAFDAWHADRTGERYFHITIPLWISVAAFILAAATSNTAARYVAIMFMPSTVWVSYGIALAWISNSIPRPPAKRAATIAIINAVSNSTSIYASYMYKESFGPRYALAMGVNAGTAFMSICGATVLRIFLRRLNRKLDRGERVKGTPISRSTSGKGTGDLQENGFRFLT